MRLNDGFERIESIEDQTENHMIFERYGKYFIFKQFKLSEGKIPYYLLICTDEPFLNKDEFNALTKVLQEIISTDV